MEKNPPTLPIYISSHFCATWMFGSKVGSWETMSEISESPRLHTPSSQLSTGRGWAGWGQELEQWTGTLSEG